MLVAVLIGAAFGLIGYIMWVVHGIWAVIWLIAAAVYLVATFLFRPRPGDSIFYEGDTDE
jgi:hypothetical protein